MLKIRASVVATLIIPASACAVYPEVSTDEEVLVRLLELEQTIADQQETITGLESKVADMEPLMAYVQVDESDPDLPTVKFVGVNVYVQSGSGSTDDGGEPSGLGNLIIGYDETRASTGDSSTCVPSAVSYGYVPTGLDLAALELDLRTGSHNLILGRYHNRAAYSSLLMGECNESAAVAASILGGSSNINEGPQSVIVSGQLNYARSTGGSIAILGGVANAASGNAATVSGGALNDASGSSSAIGGGFYNVASGERSAVVGGFSNEGRGSDTVILGGYDNTAVGSDSCVSGGYQVNATGDYSTVVGGRRTSASGTYSVVLGGNDTTCTESEAICPETW